MKFSIKLLAGGAALACMAATPAFTQSITGSLEFSGNDRNFFDPANGAVPAGSGNSNGTTVLVGSGTEFIFDNGQSLDYRADFSPGGLSLTSTLASGFTALPFTMTFTSSFASYFDNAAFGANTFNATLLRTGNTLTINAPLSGLANRTATVTFAGSPGAVPEPATWGMMILGFGALGFAMRRKSKVITKVAFA